MSSATTYKCASCGGGLVWSPEKQSFACEYCSTTYTEAQLESLAPKPEAEQQSTAQATVEQGATEQEAAIYRCNNCGAQIVTDATTAATICYYCHNPVVLTGKLSGELRPDKVIPFAIGREEAVKRFLDWVGKKWFVPPTFFNKRQIELLSGVYYPYWITDVDVSAAVDATATKVRTWRTGNTEHTETSHYRVVREGTLHFEDIETVALRGANQKLVEGIQPFDGSAKQDFNIGYLSGFVAEKRDIENDELRQRVEGETAKYTHDIISDTIHGYMSVMGDTPNVAPIGDNWEYALVPIWMLTYRERSDKTYIFAMNGQTGRIYGELPIDKGRLAILFGAVSAALFIMLMIGGMLW